METVALSDLWPILASVLGPMLLFAVALMRYQHIDNQKTRDLIEESSKENRAQIERYHRDLTTSLGEVRERLAHIEGHLRLPPPPADDDTTAEAA